MIMLQIAEQVRRTRGRPPIRSDEETRRLLIEAAAEEFQANGYAGTCMAAVAQRAGVSTKTVYRLIPNKADLLGAHAARAPSRHGPPNPAPPWSPE
jgi:AcrR family transcriptional regulator